MTRAPPYRDVAHAAMARRAAIAFEGRAVECRACYRERCRLERLATDARAVAGAFGIVIGMLTVELLCVSLAHGAFSRFENPNVLVSIIVIGVTLSILLVLVAWTPPKARTEPVVEALVLDALTEDVSGPCANPSCRARRERRLGRGCLSRAD